MHTPLRVHAALVGAQVCFGLFPLFGKWALLEVPPFALTIVRIGVGALFLSLVAATSGAFGLERRLWPRVLTFAFLGVAGNQTIFILGLARTTIVEATILTATIPALTLGAALLLRRERLVRSRLLGIALAFAGVVLLVGGAAAFARASLVGDLLIVVNSTMYSFFLVLSRDLFRERGAFRVLSMVFLLGFALALPVGLPSVAATPWASLTSRAWGSLAFIALFATVVAYAANAYGLAHADASTVAAYIYLQPAVAVTSAAVALGERFGPRQILALLLVVGGTSLVSLTRGARGTARDTPVGATP